MWAGTTTPMRVIWLSRPEQPGAASDRAMVATPHGQTKIGLDKATDPTESVPGGDLGENTVTLITGERIVARPMAPMDGDEVAGPGHGELGQAATVSAA